MLASGWDVEHSGHRDAAFHILPPVIPEAGIQAARLRPERVEAAAGQRPAGKHRLGAQLRGLELLQHFG